MIIEKKICAVIGYPLTHSLSPLLHNAAYQELELNYLYKTIEFKDPKLAIEQMLEKRYRGYSVTLPLKTMIIHFLDALDPLAKKIGAVNTIVNDDGFLRGYNTDIVGALRAIKEVMSLKNKRAIILGAGGAARAIGFGLKAEKMDLLIMNRTFERAQILAKDLNCSCTIFNPAAIEGYDLIINTTSIGLSPNINQAILDDIPSTATVMDIVYNPIETKFLKIAKENGCQVIFGTSMFLYQAVEQFKLFTGVEAPLEVMKKALLGELL